MPHDHHHHHHHVDPAAGDARVAGAIGVNLLLTVAQIAGGLVSGSLALIADAIHNLSDALSLVIAFVARRIARRPADATMTYGYGRAESVAALVNYTTLVVIALWLGVEGIGRLFDPPPVEGWIVVIIAVVALVVDLATAALTFSMAKSSQNIRAAFLHNLADAMGSLAVIVGGTVILLYDWRLIDPLITLGISAYILWHVAQDIGPVIRLLMNGAPEAIDTEAVRGALSAVEGVAGAHHIHLWQIDEHRMSVEAHLVVADRAQGPAIVSAAKSMLSDRFGIPHSTLEVETPASGCARATS